MNCTHCNTPEPPHALHQGLCFRCVCAELEKWKADMRDIVERNERMEMALKKIGCMRRSTIEDEVFYMRRIAREAMEETWEIEAQK